MAQLKAEVEALETGVKETSPKLADLADRVGQLETSLKAISQSASDGGSVASAAAIAQQIAEAEQRLDAKLADALAANASSLQEMQSAIAELKAKIGALAELGTGDGAAAGPALAALTERLAKLEAALPELAAAIGKENNGAKSAAAAIAFANLRAAVSDGRPYAAELDTISALVPSVGDLGVLPAYAEKGIPDRADLARSFVVAKEGAQVATAPASSGSLVDTLMASAQSLVTIKRIDEPTTGQGPGARWHAPRRRSTKATWPRRSRRSRRSTAHPARPLPLGSARPMQGSAPMRRSFSSKAPCSSPSAATLKPRGNTLNDPHPRFHRSVSSPPRSGWPGSPTGRAA